MRHRHPLAWVVALLLALALVAAACGGSSDNGGKSGGGGGSASGGEGTPVDGGKVTYGLDAETTGGYCLPNAQLAISGIMVELAVFEPLTWPNADGKYTPYLAESLEPSSDYKTWTIKLRPNITFHDGTPLNADAVKLNLDTYRGKNPNISAPLFSFVFSPIDNVEVVDPLTVKVTTKVPWAALPGTLSGRVGMVAPAQLANKDTCPRNPIGTGPFKFKDWVPNDHLTVVKNPNYWRKGLPHLDEITFRPITDNTQRVNALQAGQINAMHSDVGTIIDQLQTQAKANQVSLNLSEKWAEVAYTMLNVSKPPFDDIRVRQAVAYGRDTEEINTIINKGVFTIANGPFAKDAVGYVDDTGFPKPDAAKAKQLVAEVEKEKGPISFTYNTTPDPISLQTAQLIQSQMKKIGISVDIKTFEESKLINEALAGNFQATGWRNHPGGDPDTQYVWWYSTSPVNFGRIKDPEIDKLLDEGRTATDEAKRKQIYEDLNKRFGSQIYNLWGWWVKWAIATKPNVHGVLGPDLPNGDKPFPILAGIHPVSGMWVSK